MGFQHPLSRTLGSGFDSHSSSILSIFNAVSSGNAGVNGAFELTQPSGVSVQPLLVSLDELVIHILHHGGTFGTVCKNHATVL